MRKVGEDVTEILEYIPGRFEVIRHIRPACSCRKCEAMAQAPIPRGQAGPGLLAHVLVSKCCDHLPLYRQSQIYARDGVELDRALLADWMGRIAWLTAPLVEVIARHVKAGDAIHADDTPVPVLAPGSGNIRPARAASGFICAINARMVAVLRPPCFTVTHRTARTSIRSGNWRGLRASCTPMVMPGSAICMRAGPTGSRSSRLRAGRKLFDVHKATQSRVAAEAVERIGALFEIERAINGRPPAERLRVRQARAVPLLDDLAQWFDARLEEISGKSELAGAIRYARSRWEAFTRYAGDWRLEISNNAAERAIRPLAAR